jgi:serine/threonine protein kinase
MHSEPPFPRTFRPDIPEELDAIVRRAMQKDLSQRYQTWGEFTHALVNFFNSNAEVQENISDTEKFDTMRSLHFFKNVGDIELWEVLRISDWREVKKGECILRENEQCRAFFILTSGELKVTRQDCELDRLRVGDCFGEMKRFPDSTFLRTTTVWAETDATLIEINLDVLAKASVECRFQFDDAFLNILLKRLDVANVRISSLLGK